MILPHTTPPYGVVNSVTLIPTGYFSATVTWGFEPTLSGFDQDTSFAIYLNGRLQQIQPSQVRNASVILPNADTHEIEVIAYPSMYAIPDSYYAGIATRRVHLEWSPSASTDVVAYNIYAGTTINPTELYGVQNTVAVDGNSYDFPSGASVVISGAPSLEQYRNCTFTITVTDALLGLAEITNSVDAEVIPVVFMVGQPFTILDGISVVITEPPVDNDALTFPVRVLTYYDTATLAAGTYYFTITAIDLAGNESTQLSNILATINPPPSPVAEFELSYNHDDDEVDYTVTQSSTIGVDKIHIYSNYDPTTDTLLDAVYFITPFLVISASPNDTKTGVLLPNADTVPAGEYQFVARSVLSTGIESDDTTLATITLPFVADEPTIISASARQISTSEYELTWLSDGAPSGGTWYISWAPNAGSDTHIDPPVAVSDTPYLQYTYIGTVPGSGSHDITITPGTPVTVNIVFDTTPPAPPTNGTATPY